MAAMGGHIQDAAPAQPGPVRLMCLATHHKTGTLWMRQVIKRLSQDIGVPWFFCWQGRKMTFLPKDAPRVFLVNGSGSFPAAVWQAPGAMFLHVIRDPRDVLLSGCQYHLTAQAGAEPFLHEPRADLGGQTYQQHLNALPDQDARLRFEMANKHAETVAEMLAWPATDPRCFELTYEALRDDGGPDLFAQALLHLGLSEPEAGKGVRRFWQRSLSGGLADSRQRRSGLRAHEARHVVAGGRARRWQTEMPRAFGQVYAEQFGKALITLGYERDMSWVDSLPERTEAA